MRGARTRGELTVASQARSGRKGLAHRAGWSPANLFVFRYAIVEGFSSFVGHSVPFRSNRS
jgi:hypothetical protein